MKVLTHIICGFIFMDTYRNSNFCLSLKLQDAHLRIVKTGAYISAYKLFISVCTKYYTFTSLCSEF